MIRIPFLVELHLGLGGTISGVAISDGRAAGRLTRRSQSRTLPAGDVFRARLILAFADGMTYNAIKRELHTTARTISRRKRRFERSGMEVLEPRHKGSKPRTATPKVQAKVCRKVQEKPQDGSTQWSVRRLAAATGLSKSSVIASCSGHGRSHTAWSGTWRAMIPTLRLRLLTSLAYIWNRPSTPPFFVSMRKRPFRRWTAWTRCCRCPRGGDLCQCPNHRFPAARGGNWVRTASYDFRGFDGADPRNEGAARLFRVYCCDGTVLARRNGSRSQARNPRGRKS